MKRISKVAVCPKCKSYVLACHIDYIDRDTELDFTNLEREGFEIKVETKEETIERNYSYYGDCIKEIKI